MHDLQIISKLCLVIGFYFYGFINYVAYFMFNDIF